MTNFKTRKLEDVVSVYTGKPGCMCGCLGTYSYASQHKDYASNDRGYKIDESEINDRKIKLMFNKFMKNISQIKEQDGYIYYIETETRNNVIYFKEEKQNGNK